MSPDELRAKAREAAAKACDGIDYRDAASLPEAIADAVLSALLPELDARVRAAREYRGAMLKACADLVRLVAPDHMPDDVVMREDVVEIAMRLKGSMDAIARGEHRETEGGDEG